MVPRGLLAAGSAIRATAAFFLRPFRKNSAAVKRYIGERQVRIAPNQHPIEVESAFGGIGIYRTAALHSAWYSGRDRVGREICEHVAFNFGVRQAGQNFTSCPRFSMMHLWSISH